MTSDEVHDRLSALDGWTLDQKYPLIKRRFKFNDFYKTMTFVNDVANIAHKEDHHPVLEIGYNYCLIKYTTHSCDGLSEKDFVCAQKINDLPV